MYLDHFNLKDKPFQISSDPRFLWLGSKHKEALAILKYGIFDNRGFLLLSGDVGTGKTTLIRALLQSLGEDTCVAMVPDPGLSLMDFYYYIARSFEMTAAFDTKARFLEVFKAFLIRNEDQGKKVLLIIDESQRLTSELLEEIRLLSNIEKDYTKLLNIFFVGQNEFNNIILEQRNRPLRQRITINYNIEPLETNEVMEYIRYRLAVAGAEAPIFTADAVRDVYTFSEGYPRLINIICDHALLTAFVQGAKQVDDTIVRECAEELRIKMVTPGHPVPPNVETLAAGAPSGQPVIPPPVVTASAPPPEAKSPSNQTLLLVIFGLLCFVTGLLAFTLRERPDPAALDADGRPVKAAPSDQRSPAGAAKAAETNDRLVSPPSASEKASGKTGHAASAMEGSAVENDVPPALAARVETADAPASRLPTAVSAGSDVALPPKTVVYFPMNSNELDVETLQELDLLAEGVKQRPHLSIRISGYTDSGGNLQYNNRLSEFRANIIKSFMVGKGIDPDRIASRGLGPKNPIASNDTLEGRTLNRRVEIEVVEE
jgi:general secretion pathway protein A